MVQITGWLQSQTVRQSDRLTPTAGFAAVLVNTSAELQSSGLRQQLPTPRPKFEPHFG